MSPRFQFACTFGFTIRTILFYRQKKCLKILYKSTFKLIKKESFLNFILWWKFIIFIHKFCTDSLPVNSNLYRLKYNKFVFCFDYSKCTICADLNWFWILLRGIIFIPQTDGKSDERRGRSWKMIPVLILGGIVEEESLYVD